MLSLLQQQKLLHLFRIYDVDGNGYVEREDFERTVRRIAEGMGWAQDAPQRVALRARVLWQWAALSSAEDQPGSGRVRPEGWLALWNAILQTAYGERVADVSELLWAAMDRDGDGRIVLEESLRWFEFYGVSADVAEASFRSCDLNGDGVVSREEWLVLVDEFFLSLDPAARGNLLFGPFETASV